MKRRIQRQNPSSLTASIAIGGSLFVSLFLAFAWGNSLLRQSSIDRKLNAFQAENDRFKEENERLLKLYQYLQSPQYRDKWAKRHKGLAQPGEKVMIIEHSQEETLDNATGEKMLEHELLIARPNREQWKILFFPEKKELKINQENAK